MTASAQSEGMSVDAEGIERFPAAFLDERATEIRLLADHRNHLIVERTRIENRLRWHLVDLCPQLEVQVPARCLDHPVWLEKVARKRQRQSLVASGALRRGAAADRRGGRTDVGAVVD